jgi:fatty acid desaturase
MAEITVERIHRQAWKFWFVLFAYPIYLFFLPTLFNLIGYWTVLFIVFPGVFLFNWVGFLMHECWHEYVHNIPNRFFYNVFSWMMLTDPQLYRLIHGYHHSKVNTYDDTEFHPLGEIKSKTRRRIYHFLEIFLGIAFLVAIATRVVPRHPRYQAKYRPWSLVLSIGMWVIFMGGLGWVSAAVFNLNASTVVIPYGIHVFLSSVILHHSQLVEHGNLIVDGEWNERNLKARNLKHETFFQKLFLFLTHGDSREHVLHHTKTSVYSRPFPGEVPLPEEAVYIDLRDYGKILADILAGRRSGV